jgi:DNA-binding IclR family transcriptional regulator
MSTRLDKFNTLPPRPEHSKKVMNFLRGREEQTLANIVAETGLSRTQVLCVLDPLVRTGQVKKASKSLAFTLLSAEVSS